LRSLVIFDCDGVLVDSERLSHLVLCEVLAELGVSISYEDAVLRFMGTSIPVCLQRVDELLGHATPPDFLARFGERTRAAFQASLVAVPGVVEVLDGLKSTPYCVASNGNRAKVAFTLGHTGLLKRFEGRIFTAEDVKNSKPAPDLFLLAAKTLGADARRTTVVEDTPTGVMAAKAAGMRAIGYSAMTPAARLVAAGADEVASSMAEVRTLLAVPRRTP
jgi:HAD superfamily hydrolase (TIGR01509 family)